MTIRRRRRRVNSSMDSANLTTHQAWLVHSSSNTSTLSESPSGYGRLCPFAHDCSCREQGTTLQCCQSGRRARIAYPRQTRITSRRRQHLAWVRPKSLSKVARGPP
ncbi:uncharacterized protein PV09_08447 [Verruconis gallopava]|uniref:Uncharacterized protein n=1 Tax=Verruconis gallopava TaxID=253628 RepID=A0A0D1ZZT7_9PEZI|nr:uncharacterized protein PV09_08447 [Verruconis gallopava]KIV99922.1 hypothetical protein PV09_08447 [Verruconis gallopava]